MTSPANALIINWANRPFKTLRYTVIVTFFFLNICNSTLDLSGKSCCCEALTDHAERVRHGLGSSLSWPSPTRAAAILSGQRSAAGEKTARVWNGRLYTANVTKFCAPHWCDSNPFSDGYRQGHPGTLCPEANLKFWQHCANKSNVRKHTSRVWQRFVEGKPSQHTNL